MIVTRHIAAGVLLGACLAAAAAAEPARGLRFDSPGVLDLARRDVPAGNGAIEATPLADADAQALFAAPAVGEEPPALRFADDVYGCATPSPPCARQHERALIAASGGRVRRDGKRLAIEAAGAKVVFVDWKQPASKTADGDEEAHWYLGPLQGSGYERIEVQFGHDAPGNFLVNPRNGKVAFVHNGSDLVAPAPDGRMLVTWNALNPPLSLRVAALDADGPRRVLECSAADGGVRLTPLFKGWHDAASFDLVVEIGEQRKAQERVALRFVLDAGRWRLASSNPARAGTLGLACVAP
jgi:hypothetical protein